MEEKLIGRIENYNKGEHFCNITIINEEKKAINIKLEKEELEKLEVGMAYVFIVSKNLKEEKEVLTLVDFNKLEDVLENEELDKYISIFYNYAPESLIDLKKGINEYLEKIENKNIKKITEYIFKKYEKDFFIHSAATKLHHAYIGGLAYHTLTMLRIADSFLNIYTYLNKDLLFGGIILHDIAKINEITGANGEYTVEGQLLGHLVMIALEIEKAALLLGLENSEEVLLLKHIAISHHGLLNFGSPKRPQTAEALLIWFIDTIDSKFTPLKDAYEETSKGEFTTILQVLDRMKFYKHKL